MSSLKTKIEAYVGREVDFLEEVRIDRVNPSAELHIAVWNITSHKKPTDKQLNALTDEQLAPFEEGLQNLRFLRNQKLAETDWTQSRDITLSNDDAWKTYRQSLRDITKDYKSLDDVTWPEKP